MKKTILTVLITLFCAMTMQLIYIKTASPISLVKTATSIRNFPNESLMTSSIGHNETFEVTDVKTGLDESFTLWFPKILVKVKNISKMDIKEKHKLKAVFINEVNSEIIDKASKIISNNGLVFPSDTNQKFELNSFTFPKQFYKKEMKKIKVSIKLYLDDDLIGSYPLKNQTIYFKEF